MSSVVIPVASNTSGSNAATASSTSETTPSVTEVTVHDQRNINRFARLNTKEEELDALLKQLKQKLENVEEASNELMLADDDDDDDNEMDTCKASKHLSNINFQFGDCFVAVNKDDAERYLEQTSTKLKTEVKELEQKIAPMKEEMSNIKVSLYAKFGDQINLDTDD